MFPIFGPWLALIPGAFLIVPASVEPSLDAQGALVWTRAGESAPESRLEVDVAIWDRAGVRRVDTRLRGIPLRAGLWLKEAGVDLAPGERQWRLIPAGPGGSGANLPGSGPWIVFAQRG